MKRTLLLLAIGALLSVPAFAQSPGGAAVSPAKPSHPVKAPDANGGPPQGGERMGGGGMGALTPEEREEVKAARQAAMQANPDLLDQMKAIQEKINAAMIKADPKVAPLLAKMEAARQQHRDGQGGAGGPGDSGFSRPNGDKPAGLKPGGDKPHAPGN